MDPKPKDPSKLPPGRAPEGDGPDPGSPEDTKVLEPPIPVFPAPPTAASAQTPHATTPVVIGVWMQVGVENAADFAPGGYTQRVLVFRPDEGILQITQVFACGVLPMRAGKLSMNRPTDGVLRVERLPSGDDPFSDLPECASPAVQRAVSLSFQRDGDTLRLGDKTYRRLDGAEAQAVLSGRRLQRK